MLRMVVCVCVYIYSMRIVFVFFFDALFVYCSLWFTSPEISRFETEHSLKSCGLAHVDHPDSLSEWPKKGIVTSKRRIRVHVSLNWELLSRGH